MPFTPVQALQLFQGVESPANCLSADILDEVPLKQWKAISDFTKKVIEETRDHDVKRAIILETLTISGDRMARMNAEDGAMLIFVEGFDPAISRSYNHQSPYWDYRNKSQHLTYVPHLMMERKDDLDTGAVLHRHLRYFYPMEKVQRDPEHTPNPNNLPGYIGNWRPPTDHSIYQGDAIYLQEATVSLTLVGAQTATLWIVRLDNVPVPGESKRNMIWVDNTASTQSDEFLDVLRDLLKNIVSDTPPVLFLGRNPVLKSKNGVGAESSDFLIEKEWPGILIGWVEEFVVAPGGTPSEHPALTSNDPALVIEYPDNKFDRVPNISKGGTSQWQPIKESVPLVVGDAFYVLNSRVKMTLHNADVAYIRTAGVGTKRSDACNSRAC